MNDAEPSIPNSGSPQAERQEIHVSQQQRKWLFPVGVGAAALAVFLLTLAPTVTAEDSGELIAAAWHFGIPHPPGYPLWTILCGAFLHVFPIGAVAFRANLFSALFSSAAAVAYAALREMKLSKPAAATGALVWIWSYWSWSQSVITEVYPLNSLLTAALLWCAMRWRNTGSTRPLVAACLLFGLGMSNHHTIALAALALIVWIVVQEPRLLIRWRLVLKSLAAFAIGLLPYLYLPIRAAAEPPMNWGNPSNWSRFVAHVTRARTGDIGPLKVEEPRSLERFAEQMRHLGGFILDDMTPWLVGVAIAGVAVMALRHRRILGLVVLWLLTTGVLLAVLANYGFDEIWQWATRIYLIPTMLAVAIPVAFAVQWLLDGCERAFRGNRRACLAAAALVLALPPGVQLVSHWRKCDYSNYWYAYDHGRNLLLCMEPNALVFPTTDHSAFTLSYLTMVEGQRPDIMIADIFGGVRPELLRDRPPDAPDPPAAWLIRHEQRPVYWTNLVEPPIAGARFEQAGLLYRLVMPGESFYAHRLMEQCRFRNLEAPSVIDLGAKYILSEYEFCAGLHDLRRGELRPAIEHFDKAVAYREVLHNNVGSALAEHRHGDEAIPYFEKAIRLQPEWLVPRLNLVRIYLDEGRVPDAVRGLEEMIEIEPDDYQAYRLLGFVHARPLNDEKQAHHYWRESLKRNADQPDLKVLLESGDGEPGG